MGCLFYVLGAKDFFVKLYKENVPVLILSAGIGNVINGVLKYNQLFLNNIYIDSNYLEFIDGEISKVSNNIIHTMNKNSDNLLKKFGDKVDGKENIILFGDILSDINMVRHEDLNRTLTIGFLDSKIDENLKYYNNTFDIVCTNDTSFTEIQEFLNM